MCVGLDGKVVWQSPVASGDPAAARTFDLGGFLLADGMFFVVDGKSGMLRLIEANTTGYKELASAQVLSGEDVWGPLALVGPQARAPRHEPAGVPAGRPAGRGQVDRSTR